ncbi:hypothetical protein TIFTF001_028930 [Ficus carica]|uniref:Leucine-rich repeat-containing N-terminal plant-type domain-containing protein n=1 Tax=Ficus carica TaxID=3494 RepID=A0AA88DQY5_FICCA|nr:hypothetical protein TIFTF001_028930 [Ficus carica]
MLMMICSTLAMMILVSLQKVMGAGQCRRDEQSLLLQLNNSLIFSESNTLGWNHSLDCCTWEGVSCQEGRVIGLHLSQKSIVGGLTDNSSLFRLHYLKSLDLSLNIFKGTPIPSSFGNLTRLTHLNLSRSGFAGPIPFEISRLTDLVTLDLSTWFDLQSLLIVDHSHWRMLLQNLTKLEQLHLDSVNISAAGKDWGRVLSSSLPNLRALSLSDCSLSGPIDQSLLKLQSLSMIRLDINNLYGPLPTFIANFTKLTFLSLSNCRLYGTFPKEIFQVPTLESIDMSNNELLLGSLPEFSLNRSLQDIVLSYTSFSGRLPSSINNLTKLSTLDLSVCHFNGILPIFMLTELVYLNLADNKFTGPIPSFKMAKNLASVILSHNSLRGAIPSSHWEGLTKLVSVDLRHNFFNGTLPSSLFGVPSMEQINLSYNQFNGLLPEFPNVSASSMLLHVLDLSSNNLKGPIPMPMLQLENLWVLSLSFNNLNGTIQLDILNKGLTTLTHLELELSYNNLSISANGTAWASFPKQIATLYLASCNLNTFPDLKNHSHLVRLDLSDNQVHGEIPNWIWDLGSGGLSYLNLSHNYLVGIQEPCALPSFLDSLDLHLNQIRGKIPILPQQTAYADFSSNNFSSSIPADFGKNLSSQFLISLSNNGLIGVIPESICNVLDLQVLDLSSNNLSGRIPDCLSGNEYQSSRPTLDLHGNSLQGQIPKSLAYCSELEVLDLGNNKNLIDKFPCFLKNISALRVLILRSNNFHGSIACSYSNDTWAKLQIIDLAHNSFNGELPASNFTDWKAMVSGEHIAQEKLNHLQVEVLQFSHIYYQDSTMITIKGQDRYLVKILTIDICVDFSSNNFSGQIPDELGALELLYVLNLSNNAFSGPIPWSLGKLQSLESLDLSRNKLNGTIPTSLADLNFLSHLDLSFNKLVGMIPSGRQFQTFSANSFLGNQGLCGFPSATNCTDGGAQHQYSTPAEDNNSDSSETKIDWNIISVEIGFIVGFASIVGPLVFCKRLRELFFETMEDVAYRILPLSVTRKWLSWTIAR